MLSHTKGKKWVRILMTVVFEQSITKTFIFCNFLCLGEIVYDETTSIS